MYSKAWLASTTSHPLPLNKININSGAPAALRAAKRSPILIWERKGNPSMNFLMVIMASGIALGHVRTTTTATVSVK